jgi:hypothetical protein
VYFEGFDTYPCEDENETRFVTSSAAVIKGIPASYRYIFDTCQIEAQHVNSVMEFSFNAGLKKEDVMQGFLCAFNSAIQRKINDLQVEQKKTGISGLLQNKATIALKLIFLQKIKEQLPLNYSSTDDSVLNELFNQTEDKTTVAEYQRFKAIYNKIYNYQEPELRSTVSLQKTS